MATLQFSLALDDMPPGHVHVVERDAASGKWPALRPTARDDIYCVWKGKDPDPPIAKDKAGVQGMRDNRDTRWVTP